MARFEPKKTRSNEIRKLTPNECKDIWESRRDPLNRWVETHKDRIANDMKTGRYVYNADAIKFDPSGMLIDGHHRVRACVEAGVPFETLVAYCVDRRSLAKPERKPRTLSNSCTMYGGLSWATPKVIAVIKFIDVGFSLCSSRKQTVDDILPYESIVNEIERAIELLPDTKTVRGVGVAGVRACIACAMLDGAPRDMVERFCEILINGEIRNGSESAAIRCRDFLMKEPYANWCKPKLAESARSIMHCLQSFCKKRPLASLRTVSDFAYTIPKVRSATFSKNAEKESIAGIAAKRVTK